MKQYLDLCQKIIDQGERKPNRTGVDTLSIHDQVMKFDLRNGFPVVTTKRFAWKSCLAEMLGFLRGYDSAAQFRELGCKVWDANSKADYWTANPHYKGWGDLGRIYGVQGRRWRTPEGEEIDQVKKVVDDLTAGIDDRREIISYWNPGELDRMALPPCHYVHQFSLYKGRLNLMMIQRSCDFALGIPFNIAGYAWLLSVIAKITGHAPGVFTHVMGDCHLYMNQIEDMREQLRREPYPLPKLKISARVGSLGYLDTDCIIEDFELGGYVHHEPIKYVFTV